MVALKGTILSIQKLEKVHGDTQVAVAQISLSGISLSSAPEGNTQLAEWHVMVGVMLPACL